MFGLFVGSNEQPISRNVQRADAFGCDELEVHLIFAEDFKYFVLFEDVVKCWGENVTNEYEVFRW